MAAPPPPPMIRVTSAPPSPAPPSGVKAPPPPKSNPPPPSPRPPPPTPKTGPLPPAPSPSTSPSIPIHCSTAGCIRPIQASSGRCEEHSQGPPFSSGYWVEQTDGNGKYYSSLTTGSVSRIPPAGLKPALPAPTRTTESSTPQQWQTKANRQAIRQYECWKATETATPGARVGKKCVVVGDALRGRRQPGWSLKSLLLATFSNKDISGGHRDSIAPHEREVLVDGTNVTLQLWDTSGQEEDERLRHLAYFQAGVFVLTYSVTSPESVNHIQTIWGPELRQYAPGVPIVLVALDTELRRTQDGLISERDGWKLAFEVQDCLEYVECDLSSPNSVEEVFTQAARVTLGKSELVRVPSAFHTRTEAKDVPLNIPNHHSVLAQGIHDFRFGAFLGDRMYVASDDTISIVSSHGSITKLASWLRNISGVTFSGRSLFVTSCDTSVISRVQLTGKVTDYVHPPLVRALSGITSLGNDLIVGCWVGGLIVRVTPDACVKCLAQGPFRGPLSFAIYGNFLYCANQLEGAIYQIPLDGSGNFTVFARGLAAPSSLAFLGDVLYVSNMESGTISKVYLDGTIMTFASGFLHPRGLAFLGDELHVIDDSRVFKISIPIWASALDCQDAVQICSLVSVANNLCLRECVDNAGATLLARCLEGNNYLRVLDLDNNSFDDEGAVALAKLLENHPLMSISLAGNQVGDLGAMAFGKLLSVNNTLSHINLSSNKIGLAGAMSMIEGIMRSDVICKVDLTENPLPRSWIAVVGALAQIQDAHEISLVDSQLTSAQLFLLAEKLKTNLTLRSLRLENNNITEETAAALWNALNWQLATRLGLMDPNNKDILKPATKLPSLTAISVTGRTLYTPKLPPPTRGVSVLSVWLEGFSQQVKYYYWGRGDDDDSRSDDSRSEDGNDSSTDYSTSDSEIEFTQAPIRRVLDSDSDADSDNEVQFNRTLAPPPKPDAVFKVRKFNKPPPYLILETGEFAEELFKAVVSTHSKIFARDGPRNHKRISYFDSCEPTLRSVIDSVQLFCGRFLFQSTLPEFRGEQSMVLRATDSSAGGSAVALKLFREEDQFRHEMELRSEMSGHFVSEVLCSSEMFRDWSSTVERFCGVSYRWGIVMEAAERNLLSILVHERPNLAAIRDIFQGTVTCLQHLHQVHKIHCDVKPLHLLRMRDHTWRITGFSSAVDRDMLGGNLTSTAFAPPELFEAKDGTVNVAPLKANWSFDLWSMGCILFRAFTRRPLFEADDEDKIRSPAELKRLMQWNTRSLAVALSEASECLRSAQQADAVEQDTASGLTRLAALDLLGWLLQRDPQWRLPSCEMVLEHAFFKGETGVTFMSQLHLAAGLNSRQVDRDLVASTQHPLGKTPLHVAAEEGNLIAVNALLAAGAPLEATDGLGNTPVQSAQAVAATAKGEFSLRLGAVLDRLREARAR